MRRKIVAGNWKMNKTFSQGLELTEQIITLLGETPSPQTHVILSPPAISLKGISELILQQPNVFLAAQNCSDKISGAYTGELSASMLKSVGCAYVIIGHSERRMYFNEDNALLANKVNRLLEQELIPIYCCGETIEERNNGTHFKVIEHQISEGLFHLEESDIIKIVIAYEPVWAIGTGYTASSEQAQEMHCFIRNLLSSKYGKEISENISILYGGSCNASNAKDLFSNKDIDGGLIGGASLKAPDFVEIINSF